MSKTRKRSVILEQKGDFSSFESKYFYIVISLKNSIEPRVHSSLKAEEVEKLIEDGFEVTVK